jgi:hypothetical protein
MATAHEIAMNPHFRGSREFKIAAMKRNFAFPVDPWLNFGDPHLALALIFLVAGSAGSGLRKS